jgi:hypothetical protein
MMQGFLEALGDDGPDVVAKQVLDVVRCHCA